MYLIFKHFVDRFVLNIILVLVIIHALKLILVLSLVNFLILLVYELTFRLRRQKQFDVFVIDLKVANINKLDQNEAYQ